MDKILLLSLLFIFINSCSDFEEKKIIKKPQQKVKKRLDKKKLLYNLQQEYKKIDTNEYQEKYIEKVIIEGSSGLGFSSGSMQGGFVHKDDVEKIAHYVVTLSGKKCKKHKMAKKAEMFYTSNCGGCHGNDGKGLNGTFPDLTRKTLLGIEKRKRYLENEINKLSKQ